MIKLYKEVTNILFILFIVVLGIYVILRFTNKVEIYSVQTGSMEDNIHVGDYVLIYKKDNYNVGDVVTFTKDDYFITHRIIRKENDEVITKGDANNTEDEKINVKDIVGKVIISGGILNIIVNYKYAFAAIFVALYLVSCYFADNKEEISEDINNDIKEDKLTLSNEEIKKWDSLKTDKDNNEIEKKEEVKNDDFQEKDELLEEIKEEITRSIKQIEENEQLVETEKEKNNSNIDISDLDSSSKSEKNKEDIDNNDNLKKVVEKKGINEQKELRRKTSVKKKKKNQSKNQ